MIRRVTLLFMALLGLQYAAQAQQACGFDQVHRQKMATDPAYANTVNQFNTDLTNWIATHPTSPSLVTTVNGNKAYEIPVVVHVIHTGQAVGTTYNPSNTTIANFVQYLSDAFQASYAGHLLEANGGTRVPIVFKLAQRAPGCTATNGINRIDASTNSTYVASGVSNGGSNPGISDATLKALSYWPNTEYYNVWMVYKINGVNAATATSSFTAGYAYFPFPGYSPIDGTIMLSDQVATGNSVITHELGHAFNLYHVFEDDDPTNSGPPYSCPVAPGDFCNDTQPMKRSLFNCPAEGTNACNPPTNLYLNTQKNFMDYSNCKDRFTPDQRTRVWGALMNVNACRSSLISSLGATALPGTPMVAATCTPSGPAASSTLGPRKVTVIKPSPDTVIMNAISQDYNGDGSLHYFDRTCQHRVELQVGQTYTFSVTVGPTAENVRAYIDYNNDGDFLDANETIYTPTAGSGKRPDASFTVPLTGTVNCVPIRMRVITNTGSVPNSCTSPINGQAEDYSVLIRGGAASSNASVAISDPPEGGNPSCYGTTLTFRAYPGSGSSPVGYQWYRKTTAGVVSSPTLPLPAIDDTVWASNAFTNKDSVWVKMYYSTLCGTDSVLSDTVVVNRVDSVTPVVNIALTTGTNPTCPDDTLTFSVVSTINPGASPGYQWFVNGIAATGVVSGTPGMTFTMNTHNNGDVVTCKMTSSAGFPCATATPTRTSNSITITNTTKPPTASIALTTGTNPGCAGQTLTFTASGTILGKAPTYEWFKNGTSQGAPSTAAKTFSGVFNNGDQIFCRIVSNSTCAIPPGIVSSNTIQVIHQQITADIVIAQVIGGNPVCSGHQAIFSANTTNAGSNPQFQWMLNGSSVTGATTPIYVTDSLKDNDAVQCVLIATDPCVANPRDTSSPIIMRVTTSLVPTISVAITQGKNPGCLDSLIEFTASVTNLGTSPNFIWYINGFPAAFGNVFSSSSLLNGDIIECRANQTDGKCYLPDTIASLPDTLTRSTTPNPPLIHLIGNLLTTNQPGNYIWFGPKGKQITGGEDGNYNPKELGDYYAVTNNNGCWSKPSNILTITLLDVTAISMDNLKVYPNPTTGLLTLDWGMDAVNMDIDVLNPVGQRVLHDQMRGQSHKTMDISQLPNGMYYIVLKDETGKLGTLKITLAK